MNRTLLRLCSLLFMTYAFVFSACGTEVPCHKDSLCQKTEFCSPTHKVCVSHFDEPCRIKCRQHGLCQQKEHYYCIANTKTHCQHSELCKSLHFCTPKDGICQPDSTDACKDSIECEEEGKCTLKTQKCTKSSGSCGFSCVVGSKEDCQKSKLCREKGACDVFADPETGLMDCTVGSADDCKKTPDCKVAGRCTFIKNQYGGSCRATSDSDCKNARMCKEKGLCKLTKSGFCVPGSSEDCAKTEACQSEMRCTFINGMCSVGSSDSCKTSKLCQKEGKCKRIKNKCYTPLSSGPVTCYYCAPGKVEDCKQSALCIQKGLCGFAPVEDGGTCIHSSNDDCKKSDACQSDGLCHLVKDEVCGARSKADCKVLCKQKGLCSFKDGYCVATSDQDCKKSEVCRVSGGCFLQKEECSARRSKIE